MRVSAGSDFACVLITVRLIFLTSYMLKKSSLHRRTKSETQKDYLTVKTTEKRKKNVCVTFRSWSRFSVVASVAMRFFRNAARSTSKTSFLRAYIGQAICLACSVFRGRAQKDVFEAAMLERK